MGVMNMIDIVEGKDYKVKGYTNEWSVIAVDEIEGYVLLENNTWGDETCYLVAPIFDNVEVIKLTGKNGERGFEFLEIQNILCETFDGLEIALYDEGIIEEVE